MKSNAFYVSSFIIIPLYFFHVRDFHSRDDLSASMKKMHKYKAFTVFY